MFFSTTLSHEEQLDRPCRSSAEMEEKSHQSSDIRPRSRPKSRVTRIIIAILWIYWLITVYEFWTGRPFWKAADKPQHAEDTFTDWNSLKPSQKLSWTPCYQQYGPRFYCSRLTVPMDYDRPLNGSSDAPEVHLAVIMLAGLNHSLETGVFSDSPLIFNPGGPGGPGTLFLSLIGPALHKIVGTHHDLVSFDPRAIGATTPGADCFAENNTDSGAVDDFDKRNALMNRLTWEVSGLGVGLRGSSPSAIPKKFAREKAISKLCKVKDDELGDRSIFKYSGTPHVAQDMKSIVEAWDDWLDDLKSKRSPEANHVAASIDVYAPPETKGKLVYWGFSYGTFLGATFASMFPKSVGRLVLDGVVDTDIYFQQEKDTWLGGIRDADAVFDTFFTYCFLAREKCQLFRHHDTKIGDVRSRYEAVMSALERDPLIGVSPYVKMPGILDADILKRVAFSFLYSPIQLFPILAALVDNLYRGLEMEVVMAPTLVPVCENKLVLPIWPSDSLHAIGCSDKRNQVAPDVESLEELWRKYGKNSYFTDVWMDTIIMLCAGWNITVQDPPAIDWSSFPTGKRPAINTSFPIMFVSNTHDPVTPLHSGLIQSQRFAHAGLVEQLSEGHCSLAAVSLCTIKKIQAYINRGKVPKHPIIIGDPSDDGPLLGLWEKCFPDERPWFPLGSKIEGSELTIQDTEVSKAWVEIQKEFQKIQPKGSIPSAFQALADLDEDAITAFLDTKAMMG